MSGRTLFAFSFNQLSVSANNTNGCGYLWTELCILYELCNWIMFCWYLYRLTWICHSLMLRCDFELIRVLINITKDIQSISVNFLLKSEIQFATSNCTSLFMTCWTCKVSFCVLFEGFKWNLQPTTVGQIFALNSFNRLFTVDHCHS